jgi:hypothetical protein
MGFRSRFTPVFAGGYDSSVSVAVSPLLHRETSEPALARMNRYNSRCLSHVPAFGL